MQKRPIKDKWHIITFTFGKHAQSKHIDIP